MFLFETAHLSDLVGVVKPQHWLKKKKRMFSKHGKPWFKTTHAFTGWGNYGEEGGGEVGLTPNFICIAFESL